MKKENVKVAVTDKEQAEMYLKMLNFLGEKTFDSLFKRLEYNCFLSFDINGKDWFLFHNQHNDLETRQLITFGQLVDLLTRKPLLISEDGVELFEGDEFFEVNQRSFSQEWYLVSSIHKVGKTAEKWELGEKDGYVSKAFSTKKAALDWIAEQNNPKEIKVKLFNKSLCAVVNEKNISIQYCEGVGNPIEISHSDIEDILHAIQQLKGGDNAK